MSVKARMLIAIGGLGAFPNLYGLGTDNITAMELHDPFPQDCLPYLFKLLTDNERW